MKSGSFEHGRDRRNDRLVQARGWRRPDKYWSRLERHPRRHHLALQLHSLRSLDFSSYSLLKTVKILSL
jgi:hypothetical protein